MHTHRYLRRQSRRPWLSAGLVFTLLLGVSLLAACSPAHDPKGVRFGSKDPLRVENLNGAALLHVNSILIAPIQLRREARQRLEGGSWLYQSVERAARAELSMELFTTEDIAQFGERANVAAGSRLDLSAAFDAARLVGADGVLVTEFVHYHERQGSRLGVQEPARVSFFMQLYRVESQEEIWRANYHFQDQALSENLLLFRQQLSPEEKKGWRTAASLLEEGVQKVMQALRRAREQQFVRDGGSD